MKTKFSIHVPCGSQLGVKVKSTFSIESKSRIFTIASVNEWSQLYHVLQQGDTLIRVNDISVSTLTAREVCRLIRAEQEIKNDDSACKLTFYRTLTSV